MIDRYVIRLVAVPSLAGFALLLLLVTAFNAGQLLRDAVLAQFPARYVIEMLLLRDIISSEVLLPSALYVGLLVTITHWHRDREAWVIYGAGVSPSRLTRPLILLTCALALVIAFLTTVARPWAYAQTYALDAAAARLSTDVMVPHHFYSWSDELVISAAEIERDSNVMRRVFAQERSPRGTRVVRADSGRIFPPDENHRQRIELRDGTSYWLEQSEAGDRATRFELLTYWAPSEAQPNPQSKRRARPTRELLDAETPKEIAELQWRFSMPWLALFVTLIGVELTRPGPGAHVYPRYLLGIGVYALFFNLAAVGRTWVENGLVDPMPGMYWVPALTAIVYLVVRRLPVLSLARPS